MVATPYDPLVRIEGLQAVNGPASINATLIDGITTANYEGIWVPWLFVKQGSLEISGTFATLSCQLFGTNAIAPLNSYAITIAGSATNNDVITLTFNLPGQVTTATTTVVTSETVTNMAVGLVASINANPVLATFGVQASNLAGVITVTWPSYSPPQGFNVGSGVYTTSSPVPAPVILITSAVSGGATETVAVAAGTGGSSIGSAITALGMTQFTASARWLKVRVTTLTGGNVSAIAQGTA